MPDTLHASRAQRAPWCTNTSSRHSRLPRPKVLGDRQQHETEVDTEAGMLSGVSRKRSIRSNPCWFTEFCKSQCLSHFAAPFIVVRAETSVAESCKEALTKWRLPPRGNSNTREQKIEDRPKTVNRPRQSRRIGQGCPAAPETSKQARRPRNEDSHLKVQVRYKWIQCV